MRYEAGGIANEESEIDLLDLCQAIQREKWRILSAILVFAVAALAYALLANPQWEATALLRIGQVGQAVPGQGNLVETPARVVDRIKLKAFEDDVLTSLGVSLDEDDRDAVLFRNSLNAKVFEKAELIQLQVRGRSREQAMKWAEAVVAHLRETHQKLAQPSIDRIRGELDQLYRDLAVAEQERQRISQVLLLKDRIGPGNRFAESVIAMNTLLAKDNEIRAFKNRKMTLEEQLNAGRTFPTSTVERIYVPQRPAFPRKGLMTVIGAALGLIVGLTWAITNRSKPH